MASGGSANQASVAVKLLREGETMTSVAEAGAEIREILSDIKLDYPDLEYSVDTSGYGALTGGSSDYLSNSITLEIAGTDPKEISDYAARIAERLRKEPGFVEVASSTKETQPVILLDVTVRGRSWEGLPWARLGVGFAPGCSDLR